MANKKARVAMQQQTVNALAKQLRQAQQRKYSEEKLAAIAARLKQAQEWLRSEQESEE